MRRQAKVSSYAPAEDLSNAMKSIVGRLDDMLAKPDEFDLARQSRIAKEAHVAAVVAVGLGLNDRRASVAQVGGFLRPSRRGAGQGRGISAAKRALAELKDRRRGQAGRRRRPSGNFAGSRSPRSGF